LRTGIGEFATADVVNALSGLRAGAAFRHDVADAQCPRYVRNNVNGAAGLGHRAINALVALHAALYYNATYAHGFAWGGGVHGDYLGWRERLGWDRFAVSEADLDRIPGLRTVRLPGASSQPRTHDTFERLWGPYLRNASACNVAFEFPGDVWPYDVTTLAKPVLAHYFQQAPFASPAMREAHALRWNSSDVNIAVHVRKGDVENQPDAVPARIVSETVLPALRAASGGLARRAHVHVFAEYSRGYTGAAFPTLGALRGSPLAAGNSSLLHSGNGVRVTFWERASEWDAFVHMAAADFLIISQSGFPKLASLVSVKPLTLSAPSSDHYKHAHADTAPCFFDGRCSFSARARARAAAERLRSGEACGVLDSR